MQRWVVDALDVARVNCPGAAGKGDCVDYHGIRPFLYCAGLRTSFKSYSEMFDGPVRKWAGPASSPHVLVSGAADFVVPALVTWALRQAGRDPRITIIDRCRTPLVMCEDAASRFGMHWETVLDDIHDHRSSINFDLIVSDRFLSQFPPLERQAVVDAWIRNLEDGGRVLTTLSIYPGGKPPLVEDASLYDEITRRYPGGLNGLPPRVSLQRLLEIVERYNQGRRSHRIASVEEVLPLFEESGLRVLATRRFIKQTDAGLAVHPGRHLVLLVAEKSG